MVKARHARNIPAISEKGMEKLAASHVFVAGCGGLGGNMIECLARAGVGRITVADGDVFEESNLNRQILSTPDNMGQSKALAAAERIRAIDPSIEAVPLCDILTKENAASLMADADLVIDALDSIEARLMLEDAAAEADIPLIHGAVSGWDLQVMLIPPGSGLLHDIYADAESPGRPSVLSFTPAVCAGLEASLAVSYLTEGASALDGRLFSMSLKDMRSGIISL